jgi:hypothetical protein
MREALIAIVRNAEGDAQGAFPEAVADAIFARFPQLASPLIPATGAPTDSERLEWIRTNATVSFDRGEGDQELEDMGQIDEWILQDRAAAPLSSAPAAALPREGEREALRQAFRLGAEWGSMRSAPVGPRNFYVDANAEAERRWPVGTPSAPAREPSDEMVERARVASAHVCELGMAKRELPASIVRAMLRAASPTTEPRT